MTTVFKYYAIRCSPQMGRSTYAVYGYDDPRDATPPTHIEDFLSEQAAKTHYPTAVREDLFTKPWPTPTGLAPAEDE